MFLLVSSQPIVSSSSAVKRIVGYITDRPFDTNRGQVIAELPEDWKKLWHTMVPAQRFCDPYELKGVRRTLTSSSSTATNLGCGRVGLT